MQEVCLEDYELDKIFVNPENSAIDKRNYRLINVAKLEGFIVLSYRNGFDSVMLEVWRKKGYMPEPIDLVEEVERARKLLEKTQM